MKPRSRHKQAHTATRTALGAELLHYRDVLAVHAPQRDSETPPRSALRGVPCGSLTAAQIEQVGEVVAARVAGALGAPDVRPVLARSAELLEGPRLRAEQLRDLTEPHAESTELEATERTKAPPVSPKATVAALELVRAGHVGMTHKEFRGAIHRGELRAQLVGREYAAKRADFDAYLAARRVEPAPPKQRPRRTEPAEAAVERALAAGQLRTVRGPKR